MHKLVLVFCLSALACLQAAPAHADEPLPTGQTRAGGAPAPVTDATPAPAPPQIEDHGRLVHLIEQVRSWKELLNFRLGAGVYLFYYQPLSRDTTLSGGNLEGTFQVFAYYLKLDAELRGFGAHTEARMRDGGHIGPNASNSYFRGFYSSNFWFQEVYAYYTPGPFFKIKVGKMYRQVGIFWDDSFFGNIQFYDGLKLNADYGASAEGDKAFLGGRLTLSYALQFFLQSDGINGGIDFGRTLGGPPMGGDVQALRLYSPNPEGQLDSTSAHVGAYRNMVTGRLSLSIDPVPLFGVTLAASGLTGSVQRVSQKDRYDDEERMTHVSGDATVRVGPALAYGEYLRQFGPGVRDADYALIGARLKLRCVALRINVSYVDYHLSPDIEEIIIQPGITYSIGYGLTAFLEFNEWERKDPRLPVEGFYLYDRSLNVALGYSY